MSEFDTAPAAPEFERRALQGVEGEPEETHRAMNLEPPPAPEPRPTWGDFLQREWR